MARKSVKKKLRIEQIEELLPRGWQVHSWSPGDGQTRYKFFHKAPLTQTYYGPASAAYTALGLKEAMAYAAGLAR